MHIYIIIVIWTQISHGWWPTDQVIPMISKLSYMWDSHGTTPSRCHRPIDWNHTNRTKYKGHFNILIYPAIKSIFKFACETTSMQLITFAFGSDNGIHTMFMKCIWHIGENNAEEPYKSSRRFVIAHKHIKAKWVKLATQSIRRPQRGCETVLCV